MTNTEKNTKTEVKDFIMPDFSGLSKITPANSMSREQAIKSVLKDTPEIANALIDCLKK